jgi:hypothetical protein
MLTNSKIALSIAIVLATASAAAAAPKLAVHHQAATARQLPADANVGAGSVRSGDLVSAYNPCYFKIQTIGNREGDGMRPTTYSCRRINPGRS